ncbi:MAG: DUF6089 family protein [Bacteroidia bacterium]
MKKFLLFVLLFSSLGNFAQRNDHKQFISHDVGVFIGGSYYIGDLNPRRHFFQTQPAGGVFYRYNYNYRLAFRGGFNIGSVVGDDSQSSDDDQLERNLNFKSKVQEFHALAEFNFVEYSIGHNKFIFSPYVFLGISVFHFDPMANMGNQWVDLRRMSTEGQKTSQNPGQKQYKLIQPSIPFGFGFKLDLAKNVGLGFEWGPRKTFTDYLDDVSGKYVNPLKLAAEKGVTAGILSDRSLKADGTSNIGKQRGNPYTKDWYFFYGFTINFKLKQKPAECRGVGH